MTADGTVKVWSLTDGRLVSRYPINERESYGIQFSPTGKFLVLGGENNLRILDSTSGAVIASLLKGIYVQSSGFYSPDEQWLLGRSSEGLRLFEVRDGVPLEGGTVLTSDRVAACFAPDGATLAAGGVGGVRLWDVPTRRQLTNILHGGVGLIAFSHDGRLLATGSADGSVIVWDAASLRSTISFGDANALVAFALSPDGHTAATSTSDHRIKLWNTATGDVRFVPNTPDFPHGHRDRVQSVAFSPSGVTIASASRDGVIKIWQRNSGDVLATLDGWTGNRVFNDYPARDLGQFLERMNLAFSPDGRYVASAAFRGNVTLWDTANWQKVADLPHKGVEALAFSQDGCRLISGSPEAAKMWNVERIAAGAVCLWETFYPSFIDCLVFSPDGSEVLVAGRHEHAIVCDIRTGEPKRKLSREGRWLSSAAYSPDGSCIVTSSTNGELIFWRSDSGEQLGTLRVDEGLRKVAFFADGSLVSASMNGTLRIWRATPQTKDAVSGVQQEPPTPNRT